MTFDDDFLLFQMPSGPKKMLVRELGLQWPPPQTLRLRGFEPPYADIDFRLLTISQISDLERAVRTDVCRGAQYVFAVKGVH